MLACFGPPKTPQEKEDTKRSRRLDKKLAQWGKAEGGENKLLLLGAGESGKSTVFKQMKILGAGGFSEDELKSFRPIIASNCITQIQVLISAMNLLDIPYGADENKAIAEELAELPTLDASWDNDLAKKINAVWNDSGIQAVYEERDKEFQLNDSAAYFLSSVERFEDPAFIPTILDVLQARVRTSGIEEAQFNVLDFQFRMMDVGGQRCERKKWMSCFEGVTAVIFCASLNEYDQTLREAESQNRMHESLQLFQDMRAQFRDTSFIVFLNKIDLFQEKIKRVSLDKCFSDWKVSDPSQQQESECKSFIREKFLERDVPDAKSKIIIHFTCALDTENIRVIFESVKKEIIDELIEDLF